MPAGGYAEDGALKQAQATADSWLLQHKRQREADVERSSERILDHRVASLRESHERWIARLEDQLREAEEANNPIARVRRASLEKHRRNLGESLARKIEKEMGISAGWLDERHDSNFASPFSNLRLDSTRSRSRFVFANERQCQYFIKC